MIYFLNPIVMLNNKHITPVGSSEEDAREGRDSTQSMYKDIAFTDLIGENDAIYQYYLADEAGEDFDIVEEREDILVF
jgi:hypothetical protein